MNLTGRAVQQKREYLRNEAWLRYVKSLPSCISGQPADDAHHIKGYASLTGAGGSIKGDDLFAIPLTRAEHTEFHAMPTKEWEEFYGMQAEHALATIRQGIIDGVLKW
ncbi:hypothetical protein [Caudoviricetes sp.]|nr:hypothetical protein [Caudoviricetes sp.]